MQIKSNGQEATIVLTKRETERILEVSYMLDRIARNVSDPAARDSTIKTTNAVQAIAKIFGGKHIGEDGQIKETQRQKLVDESEPDVFDSGK